MNKVAAVIPFFRETAKLERCLEHLRAQTHGAVELFVRDNTNDNIYYTAAVNEGLRRFCFGPDVDWVMVLNQDAYLAPEAIAVLDEHFKARPRCGIASPVQHLPDGRINWSGSLQAFPSGRHRKDAPAIGATPYSTPWANGAAFAVRCELAREIGLLDRNMRFICSDADYCFTARARGWTVDVVPGARCTHEPGASGVLQNLELSRIMVSDILYFARKWLNGDLYRELAFEGATLTPDAIRLEMDKLARVRAAIDQRIALDP